MDCVGDGRRVCHRVDEERNFWADIGIIDQSADILHGSFCCLLDFRLGVPHGIDEGLIERRQQQRKLNRCSLDKDIEKS